MQALQARIDSFHKARRVKRYPNKPSSSIASVKWPHSSAFKANPNTLAEAGFFFSPSWDDRDSVACFLCGKELSDWDATDDPFDIHYSKCRTSCAWASVRCGLMEDMDDRGCFVFENKSRVPSSKAMEKARLETFGQNWWPHDREPGHTATSVKMAQAGFVYTPQGPGDDTVTCLYCNLSLGGWEKGDDPVQEHRRRDRKSGANSSCTFLASSSKQTRSKVAQPSLPSKKPPPVNKTEQPSEDELATIEVADPPRPPPAPRDKRGKARSMISAPSSKPRRKTRATRGKSTKPPVPAPQRSPSPSQTISHAQDETIVPDTSMDVDVPPADEPEPSPDTRPRAPSVELQQDNRSVHANGSIHSLPNGAMSPPSSSGPSKPDTPPDVSLNHPDPIVSLSPTGEPTITNSQILSEQEKALSLEQWIRQEINTSYEKLWTDGQRQIALFKTRAAELRRCIDDL